MNYLQNLKNLLNGVIIRFFSSLFMPKTYRAPQYTIANSIISIINLNQVPGEIKYVIMNPINTIPNKEGSNEPKLDLKKSHILILICFQRIRSNPIVLMR